MDTFNKKSLCVALAATGVLGAAGVAQAVNVSADGLGNVLIYPYYTVNNDLHGNSFNTLMSVVNTTGSTKAVKVRFREGKNSVEVLDFNVFLSPFDVWTASITPGPVATPVSSGTQAPGGAQIATTDKSCTIPTFPATGVPFRTLSLEAGDNAAARTSEGYFEVFEMATYDPASIIAVNSKHSGGVPLDCTKVTDAAAQIPGAAQPPSGGLFGGLELLSPAGGGMFSQAATALDNFSNVAVYSTTGSQLPDYSGATPPVSNVIMGVLPPTVVTTAPGPFLYQTDWTTVPNVGASPGVDAVTAVLMANAVTNEYVLDIGSQSQTTWIVTFPTKYNFVNQSAAIAPFTSTYVTKVGACEAFYGVVFNREEGQPQFLASTDFSPQPGPAPGVAVCWEAQSLGFGSTGGGTTSSNIFGSANHNNISTPYSNGWSTFGFNNPLGTNPLEHSLIITGATNSINLVTGALTNPATTTYMGLPVVGFAAQTFQNNAIVVNGATYLSTFGASFPHHATKDIHQP